MTPYASGADWTIWHGDCRAILPTLDKGSVDAVVTDPPYGIGYDPQSRKNVGDHHGHERIVGDSEPFDPSPLLGFGRLVLWGANCYADRLPVEPCWLAWDKVTRGGLELRIAEFELAWTRGIRRPQMFRHLWSGNYRASESGEFYHPTQKPIALMEWCVGLISEPEETILDPFAGSGPTGVACIRTGRKFIGIEIEERYCEIAARRISQAEPALFIEAAKAKQLELMETR